RRGVFCARKFPRCLRKETRSGPREDAAGAGFAARTQRAGRGSAPTNKADSSRRRYYEKGSTTNAP
ncbi:Protein of unknown function, partial [Gryllus bimaculatus]